METLQPFIEAEAVARYARETPSKVPGYADLHRMTMLLLAERTAERADILVYGAGGGLELKFLAQARPGWRFVGVDPSAEMLALARDILGPHGTRVDLLQGYIDKAPSGPFDGATCLLTLHFLARNERLAVLRSLRSRIKPGGRLVVAHHSYPTRGDARLWLARSIAFADTASVDFERATASAAMMESRLPVLSAEEDEALLEEAGFSDIGLFYAAFSFRGWVATA